MSKKREKLRKVHQRTEKNENSRSVSRVLYFIGSDVKSAFLNKASVINLDGCITASFLRSLPSRLDEQPSNAGLHEIATRSVAVSSSFRMPFVAVPWTKHCCLPAVNRYVALCCPDFPLKQKYASTKMSALICYKRQTDLLFSFFSYNYDLLCFMRDCVLLFGVFYHHLVR